MYPFLLLQPILSLSDAKSDLGILKGFVCSFIKMSIFVETISNLKRRVLLRNNNRDGYYSMKYTTFRNFVASTQIRKLSVFIVKINGYLSSNELMAFGPTKCWYNYFNRLANSAPILSQMLISNARIGLCYK